MKPLPATDKPECGSKPDVVEIVISNPGRMPVWVESVEIADLANLFQVPLPPEAGLPIKIEPTESLRLQSSRGRLEDDGITSFGRPGPDTWWDEVVVRVRTGDGQTFQWGPRNPPGG